MSGEQNLHQLIEIAARLQEASLQDERLKHLALEATKLVLDDSNALAALFNAYLHPPLPTPPQASVNPSSVDVAQAKSLIQKLAKELNNG